MNYDDTDRDLVDDDDEECGLLQQELITFERLHNQEMIPERFSSATVLLDASPTSLLKWDEAIESAEELIRNGLRVLFDFNLEFHKPFSHSGQFQTYSFALTHFRETVWPKFKNNCSGVILCRSSLAFDKKFLWGQQEINTRA